MTPPNSPPRNAAVDPDLAFVVASARRLIEGLKADPRLQLSRRASKPGGAMARYVLTIVRDVEAALEERAAVAGADDIDRITNSAHVRLLNTFLLGMQRALPWLDDAPRGNLPLGVRYFLQELSHLIVKLVADPIPVAFSQWATEPRPFERPAQALRRGGVNVDVPTPAEPVPVVLTYPERQQDAVLLHALFAHELSHTALRQHPLVPAVLDHRLRDPEFDAALSNAAGQVSRDRLIHVEKDTLIEVLRRWTDEIFCDAIACHVMGPSYVFSFASQVLSTPSAGTTDQHPPPAVRINLLLDQLNESGWSAVFEEGLLSRSGLTNTFAWLRDVGGAELETLESSLMHLVDVIYDIADDVRAKAAAHLGPAIFAPDQYVGVHARLTALIDQRILPAQLHGQDTGRPRGAVDRRAILLAGWLYMFDEAQFGDSPTTLSRGVEDPELQIFIARALEMSRILEEWREA